MSGMDYYGKVFMTDNVRREQSVRKWFFGSGRKGVNMEYLELGNLVRDIDPDMQAGNPRNSEGTFLETKKDGIL